MLNFYDAVYAANPNNLNITVTLLDGKEFGQKALISDHRIIWQSQDSIFFHVYRNEVEQINKGGIYLIGGQKIFCELLGQRKKMVICGGGHVSIPIIKMGIMIGFIVTVLEDRPKFADNARRAGADNVFCGPFVQELKKIKSDENTFFVIVTRGHRYDQICLESIVRKPHAYVGMIGSRRRVAMVKKAVIEDGADPDIVNRIYSPIGLNIGAETPEEIAVSILAEIITVKNQNSCGVGYSKNIMKAILGSETEPRSAEAMVLATIVSRHGSAPREVGTKMLILPDGKCIDSIGGGCAESEIMNKALLLLRTGDKTPQLCHIDMIGRDSEDEGMVCGGVIDVLLEKV